ncbi:MAG: pyridoxamine 5-phosphate oxidase [Rhodospirillaceae bacterium]|nr:MAG: pyridoxamine 5-phosphate oxidase [Rhodospirillaceae bacterium]
MPNVISDVATLEACLGKKPEAMDLKVIDHLDDGALQWLAASTLVFAGFGDNAGISMTIGGGEAGFATAADRSLLTMPLAMLDNPACAQPGQGFGSLFLIPGIGETMRINGRILAAVGDRLEIAVDECFLHCAKALIRSDFWNASRLTEMPADAADFLEASRFLLITTVDADGQADVSPKGDPQGATMRLIGGTACYAERPGNRRADSYRNMLNQPRLGATVLIPGSNRVAFVSGTAQLTSDEDLRQIFAVQGKAPLLVTRIVEPKITLATSDALARAEPWSRRAPDAGIDPAAIMVRHVKLNKERGLQARILGTALSIPGLMAKGLAQDYKKNLY